MKYPALFLLLALAWGSVYPITKIGLTTTEPIVFAGLRGLLGGLFLLTIALAKRGTGPATATDWRRISVLAFLNSGLFLAFLNIGIGLVPAGLASILTYTQPLWVALFARLWLDEPLTGGKLVGLACGFLGIVVVMADRIGTGSTHWLGIVVLTAAAISWALGAVFTKRHPVRVDVFMLAALQSLIGTAPLIPIGLAIEPGSIHLSWTFIWTLALTGLGGTGVGFLLWLYLVKHRETSEVGAYIFLVPFFAVIFSVLILHERIGVGSFVGGALVFAGIYLVNRSMRRKAGRIFPPITAKSGSPKG